MQRGERFVDELLPRDIVSRAITAQLLRDGTDHVWLDATVLDNFDERFPTILDALLKVGLDPATDWLPVAPAAHYCCGGVVADLDGATSLPGLWVAGEVACNGVHGANRLASNSLLDGMVFGPRVVEAIDAGKDASEATGAMRCVLGGTDGVAGRPLGPVELGGPTPPGSEAGSVDGLRDEFQRMMTAQAGVLRSDASLAEAIEGARAAAAHPVTDVASAELHNLATLGVAVAMAARARTETRGAHTRTDHPETDPALELRLVLAPVEACVAGCQRMPSDAAPDVPDSPPIHAVRAAVVAALAEDLTPLGDLSAALVPQDAMVEAAFVPRIAGVVAGTACVTETFAQLDGAVAVEWSVVDGDAVTAGQQLGVVRGRLAPILTGERTALNFLCHLSGVATITRAFATAAARGGSARIWDTRKTTPGLRSLEKAAVRAGGGANHRGNLSDWVMFKDNHLAGIGIDEAVRRARHAWPARTVHVEVDDLAALVLALDAGADAILLDNFTPDEAAAAVRRADEWAADAGTRRPWLECSGGITVETAEAYSAAGVDLLSTSQITQSAPALDIGLDIVG